MIYAINKRTKEHYEVPYFSYMQSSDWRYVEADADGWIEWRGGECPLPKRTKFEVRRRDGEEVESCFLISTSWSRDYGDKGSEIIAYRPILDEPEAPEWDGKGLPPVGCECDAIWLELPDGGSRDFEPVTVKGVFTGANGKTKVWFSTLADEDMVMREGDCQFRPILSAEKQAIEAMRRAVLDSDRVTPAYSGPEAIYHAIREGKIPGVKMENAS